MDDVHLAVCLSLLIRYWQEECCNSAMHLRLLSSHWLRNKYVHIFFTQNHDVWETTCSVLLWCLKTINTRTGSVTCLSELLGAAYLWSKETDVLALQLQLWPSKSFPSFYHLSCTRPAWPMRTQCYYLLDLSINATQYWLRVCVCMCVWKCETSVGGYTFILVAD